MFNLPQRIGLGMVVPGCLNTSDHTSGRPPLLNEKRNHVLRFEAFEEISLIRGLIVMKDKHSSL